MESVRYLSYQQWKHSKFDAAKNTTYHQKLLSYVEALETNTTSIDKLIAGYLDATKTFCGAGSHLAEAFSLVLKETPLLEITQQLKQVVEEVDHVAHKSSVHITNYILGTLCEFTATFPGLRRSIEAHKRSVQNYETCQETLEMLEKEEGREEGLPCEAQRLKTARQRFRSATEELATEEELLYRSFAEVEENRVKMLGASFLSLLQVQSQFMTSAAEYLAPLGGFQEIGDYLRDREVTLSLKDATASWLSLAQVNKALRQGPGLSRKEIQQLMQVSQGELAELAKKGLIQKINTVIKNYKKEFERAPTPEADIPAGFHKNPKGIELALKGCCSNLEAIAAGGFQEVTSNEEMESQILKEIPKLHLKIGNVSLETCSSPSKVVDNFKSKMHVIHDLVNSIAKTNDIPLNKEILDHFVLTVLHETCSPVCLDAAKTAVQLLFGKADLVTVKLCKESNTRLAQVYPKGTSVNVEVSSTWIIVENSTTFGCLSQELDSISPLGVVDAVYVWKFSLMDYLEDKERPLPAIHVKRRSLSSNASGTHTKQSESSLTHKHKSFRKSFSKATSKIFSRMSMSKTSSSIPTIIDSANELVATPGTGSEQMSGSGFRNSVSSGTDTSLGFESEKDEPAPLPPPRPKHWAKMIQAKNNQNDVKDALATQNGTKNESVVSHKIDSEGNSNDDWFKTSPKLPLPLFKPTVPTSSQSQLSLASEEELVEVINFLSGAPLRRRTPVSDEKDTNTVIGSHVMSTDSGMGSCLSVASSYFTPTGSVAGRSEEGERKISSDSQGSGGDDVVPHPKVSKKHKGKSPSSSPSKDKFRKHHPVPTEAVQDKEKTNKGITQDKEKTNKAIAQDKEKTNIGITQDKQITNVKLPQTSEGKAQKLNVDPVVKDVPDSDTRSAVEEKVVTAVEKERDAAGSKDIKQEGTEKQVSSAVHNPVDKVQVKSEVQSSSSVVVTVSMAEELEAEKGIFISESLRSVWERAEPQTPAGSSDGFSSESSFKNMKETYGSQETLYHSCWSLADCGSGDNGKEDSEDTKSLNESLLPSNSGPGMPELGLKWPSGFGGNLGGNIWGRIPSEGTLDKISETGAWHSQEGISTNHGNGGRNVFTLGLGITGTELFAVARQGSRESSSSQVNRQPFPPAAKRWSSEDVSNRDPWPSRDISPPLLWHKATSLTDEAQRPMYNRPPLVPQHYSDPFLPREQLWSGAGYSPTSTPRFHTQLQRQLALDGAYQGMQGPMYRGQCPVLVSSAFQPVQGFHKQSLPHGKQAHLQVPSQHFHNPHHGSNPRF